MFLYKKNVSLQKKCFSTKNMFLYKNQIRYAVIIGWVGFNATFILRLMSFFLALRVVLYIFFLTSDYYSLFLVKPLVLLRPLVSSQFQQLESFVASISVVVIPVTREFCCVH